MIVSQPFVNQGQRAIGEMSRALVNRGALFVGRLDPTVAELWSALAAIGFGAVLLMELDTFGRVSAYRHLAVLGTEELWGTVWLTVGLAQLVGVALVGSIGCCWRVRQTATFLAAVLWVWWLWSLWSSTGLTPGVTTYAILMAGSVWGWVQAGR